MLVLLPLLLLAATYEVSRSQVVYSQVVPYDPRYLIRRPPVRRSAMDTLERMRLPMARYFPQVEPQVAQFYPLEDVYALPPQWAEGLIQQGAPDRMAPEYEEGPEYESDGMEEDIFAPVYRSNEDIAYPQQELEKSWVEPQPSEYNPYGDLMVNYVYGSPHDQSDRNDQNDQDDLFDVERRDQPQDAAPAVPLAVVAQANQNVTGKASVEVVSSPPAAPTVAPPQAANTAVPPAPEKKEVKSLVLPEPEPAWLRGADMEEEEEQEEGQKEEPLFRPRQSSQQTRWAFQGQEKRPARSKVGNLKSPIPMIKKMIQTGHPDFDPLTEELRNLRKLRKP